MKTTLAITMLAAVLLSGGSKANAQYRPTGEDGITASPKVRQRLDDRAAQMRNIAGPAHGADQVYKDTTGVAASPKVQAQMREYQLAHEAAAHPANVVASTTRPPNDGIAASPKLREQMFSRPQMAPVEVAPISR